MKKLLLILAVSTLLLSGCTGTKGEYTEGLYIGTVENNYGGKLTVITATVVVGEDGMIDHVYVDETYEKDGAYTTKKTLGDEYGMKGVSASIGNIEGGGEWYEQLAALEEKVVEEQNLDFVKYTTEDPTVLDGVSGCTISANTYVEAIELALEKAK